MHKLINILLLICLGQCLSAQSSRYWILKDDIYRFKNADDIELYNTLGTVPTTLISHSNGSPLLSYGCYIVNCDIIMNMKNGQTIKNGDSIVMLWNSFFVQRNDSIYDLIGNYDSSYMGINKVKYYYKLGGYAFDTIEYFSPGYYSHSILKTSKSLKTIEKNRLLKPVFNKYINIDNINRVIDFKYRFISSYNIGDNKNNFKGNLLQLYNYSNDKLEVADSISITNTPLLFKEPIPLLTKDRLYNNEYVGMGKLSFNQDKLFYIKKANLSTKIQNYFEPVIESIGLYMIDIDPLTGKIVGNEKLLKKVQQRTEEHYPSMPKGTYYSYSDFEISPNDSIFYFIEKQFILDSVSKKRVDKFIFTVYSWRFRDEVAFNPTPIYILDQNKNPNNFISTIAINPYGKLSIFTQNSILNKDDIVLNLNETNNPKGLLSTFNISKIRKFNNISPIQLPLFLYDYIRLDSKIDYSCEAKVSFQNRSDLSGGMKDFTWYFTKGRGKTDTVIGFEPEIIYTKSGDYPFKVHGYSPRGKGYGEWYIDTVHIRIPPKPIASFKAVDTVICRYLPLKFINQSYAKEIKQGTQEKYVWTFGDGSTSYDREPTHTYTQTGVYPVSLLYSNGYCDSTLVKNQYIRVVDAPKPGFSTEMVQGCLPYTVSIKDTVWHNVTKKEYLFTDTSLWQQVSSNGIYHTFFKPGHYWAVQKLYGYTGCIIRTDSVKFYISKGILPKDSLAIVSASFDTSNNLRIEWQIHQAAVSYNVYRSVSGTSYKIIANTENTNYIDSLCREQAFYYKVKAVDSCGKLTQSLNEVKPHYITTNRMVLNQAAIIEHQAAQGMGVEQNLILQSSSDFAINLALEQTNPINPYRDENFAVSGYLRKCYRIQAEHKGKKVYSNYECINYEPLVYIPNAFSPNGDGNNEVFKPSVTGIISYELKIFNRWGQLIYKGNTSWDGTISGKTAEQGVYFFNLRLSRNDLQNEIHSGMVHLIR